MQNIKITFKILINMYLFIKVMGILDAVIKMVTYVWSIKI